MINGTNLVNGAAAVVADVLVHGAEAPDPVFKGTRAPWLARIEGGPMVVNQHGTPILYASVAHGAEQGTINVKAAAQVPAMIEALSALGAEWQDIFIHQCGDVHSGKALEDVVKVIEAKVLPVLRALHAAGAL